MIEPQNTKLFYEENKNKTFYYLKSNVKNVDSCEIKEVKPDCYCNMILWYYPKDNTDVKKITKFNASWLNIFETKEDACKALEYYKSLYSGFRRTPYLSVSTLIEHCDELRRIEQEIEDGLKDVENYEGIDFVDVSANGIQIRLHHKQIKNYTYGNQYTIRYDFSNADEAPKAVIEHFKEIDNPADVQRMLRFIADGEKYGWD